MAQFISNFYSTALKKNTKVVMWIPSVSPDDFLDEVKVSYFDEGSRFQTLYLLHGSYGGSTDWSLLANVERYAQENTLAVVMPEVENSMYINLEHGENYLEFCGKELPEFCSTVFPLARKRENRYVGGLSMGGFGTLQLALAYPETFSKALVFSACVDMDSIIKNPITPHGRKMPGSYKRLLVNGNVERMDLYAQLSKRAGNYEALPSFYFYHGSEDPFLEGTMAYADKLEELGCDVHKIVKPGKHDWIFWDAYVQEGIKSLQLSHSTVTE